jgi:hypothetical protein
MTSSVSSPINHPTAVAAEVNDDRLEVTLADGRELFVPVGWFPWLAAATAEQRADLEIIEDGQGIWWESLEDSLSVPGLLGLPHV